MSDVLSALIERLVKLEAEVARLKAQELNLPAGAASAPAVTLAGDTDTGIYHSAQDNLDFSTGGTNRLNVSSDGLTVTGEVLGSTAVGARVYTSGAFTHNSSGNWLPITFDSETNDPDGLHSTSTNTSRITVAEDGLYLLAGTFLFPGHATGYRMAAFRTNGSSYFGFQSQDNLGSGTSVALTIAGIYSLSATHYVELCAWQNSGGSLNIPSGAVFAAYRIA